MTFQVYPRSWVEPLTLAAGASSEVAVPAAFGPAVAGVTTMVIRVAVGTGDGPPRVVLVADGTSTEVTAVGGVDPTPLAGDRAWASLYPIGRAGRGVFRLDVHRVAAAPAIGTWAVRFVNDGADETQLVWVVADSLEESRQPWIHVRPPAVDVGAPPAPTRTFEVLNRGTGPLQLTDPEGAVLAPGVALRRRPQRLAPRDRGALVLTLTAEVPAGGRLEHDVGSTDTTAPAGGADGHNRHLTVAFTPWTVAARTPGPVVLGAAGATALAFEVAGPAGHGVTLGVETEPVAAASWCTVERADRRLGGTPEAFSVTVVPPAGTAAGTTGTVTAVASTPLGVLARSAPVAFRLSAFGDVITTMPTDAPAGALDVSPDGRRVYVVHTAAGAVSVLDTGSGQVRATTPLHEPSSPAARADGARVYVGTVVSDPPFAVPVLDAEGSVVASIPVDGIPQGVAVDPHRPRAYAALWSAGALSVIATDQDAVLGPVPVAERPLGVAVDPVSGHVYVASHGHGDDGTTGVLSVVDPDQRVVLGTVALGRAAAPVVHPQGRRVYVPRADTVVVIDPDQLAVADTIPVPAPGAFAATLCRTPAVSPDGRYLYLTRLWARMVDGHLVPVNELVAVDLDRKEVAATGPLPEFQTSGLVVAPDGRRAYVTDRVGVRVVDVTVPEVVP